MKHYKRRIRKILRSLGVNNSYVGFEFVAYGVELTIYEPTLLTYICKGLYIEIAIHFKTSINCVERNIRTVVEKIWEQGDREALNQIFNKELKRKPKNAEFFDALVEYVRNVDDEKFFILL